MAVGICATGAAVTAGGGGSSSLSASSLSAALEAAPPPLRCAGALVASGGSKKLGLRISFKARCSATLPEVVVGGVFLAGGCCVKVLAAGFAVAAATGSGDL